MGAHILLEILYFWFRSLLLLDRVVLISGLLDSLLLCKLLRCFFHQMYLSTITFAASFRIDSQTSSRVHG